MSRLAEVGLAQKAPRHRQNPPLAGVVRRDGVEDRGKPVRGVAVERKRGREQLRDLDVVERRRHACHNRHGGRIVRALHHLHDHVRIELRRRGRQVGHDIRHAIRRHHRHDVGQMAEGGENRGGLRRDHRRAVGGAHGCGDGDGEIADVAGAGGNGEQALLGTLVEDGLLPAGDRHDDRPPEVVAPGGLRNFSRLSRQEFLVVDLLDRDGGVAFVRPDAGRPAASSPFRGIEREDPQQDLNRLRRHAGRERDRDDVAIVQHRGGLGDAALRCVGCNSFDHQRVRRDADRQTRAKHRVADRGGQPLDRGADDRVLRRIECRIAHTRQQGAGHVQQAPRQFR